MNDLRSTAEDIARRVKRGTPVMLDTLRCAYTDIWLGAPLDRRARQVYTITVGNRGYLDLVCQLGRLRRELQEHLAAVVRDCEARLFDEITVELSLDTSGFDAAIAKVCDATDPR